MNLTQFIYPALASFIITIVLTPLVIKIAKRYRILDDPKTHKHPAVIHKKPVPRAGGVPIYIATFITSYFTLTFNFTLSIIFFCGFLVVLVGVLDDKYDLSPYIRFILNIIIVGIVVFSGVSIPFITNPLGGILHFGPHDVTGYFLPQILAIVWIVWVMNMLNWSKGVDGQMPGIAAISATVIGIASLRFPILGPTNIEASQLAFIVAGAAVGFLIYNFYPAKIFPGYSATILGFFIGILSVISGVKLATAILVMGVPIVDGMFTITRRLASKKSPFWHDKEHLHHLLLRAGFGQRRIAIFYWAMSAILGFIALNLSSKGKLFAIILLLVLVGGFIFTLRYLIQKEK